MPNNIAHSIIQTLAWFDLFDYPLTAEELYRWLWQPQSNTSHQYFLTQIIPPLVGEPACPVGRGGGRIQVKRGYYFLLGREAIVSVRQKKIPLIEKKLQIARRAAKKMRWVPFARAVFVANTVAAGTAEAESDIDVLVIVKRGRLYLTRLLVTLLLQIFRLRRTKQRVANRVCLCFYLTDESLDLSAIRLGEPDIYLAYWLAQLIPLYDPAHLHHELMKKNQWARAYLPQALNDYTLLGRYRVDDNRTTKVFRAFFETAWRGRYGDQLESQAKAAQLTKMKMNRASLQNEPDSRVVINDQMLKFHENDRREEYRKRWQESCQKLTGDELEIRLL